MANGEIYFGAFASVTLSGKTYSTTTTNITFANGKLVLSYKSRFSSTMMTFKFENVVHTVREEYVDSKSSVVTRYLDAGKWKSTMIGEINKTRTWYRVHTFEIRGQEINGSEGACYAWITERREQKWSIYTAELRVHHMFWESFTADGNGGEHAGRYAMEHYLSGGEISALENGGYDSMQVVRPKLGNSLGIDFSSTSYRVDSAEVSPSLLLYMRVAMTAEDPNEEASTVEF